jgi:chromatin segregation and condensation protein Rec8/ScpA/Scc1 (kleisin family)
VFAALRVSVAPCSLLSDILEYEYMGAFSRMLRASARASRRAYAAQVRAQKQAIREAERVRKAAERARVADQKEKARLYVESRIEETKNQNDDLQHEFTRLSNLLIDSLSHPFSFNPDSLIKESEIPNFEPGKLAVPYKMKERQKVFL